MPLNTYNRFADCAWIVTDVKTNVKTEKLRLHSNRVVESVVCIEKSAQTKSCIFRFIGLVKGNEIGLEQTPFLLWVQRHCRRLKKQNS